jgi:formamidopyrimidine-DNA glycosylase
LVTQGNFTRIAKSVSGASINSVRRVGKNIMIELDRGVLHLHLGMTGKLLWNAPTGPYTRAVIELDNGTLIYDDVRQFGRLNFYRQLPASVARLGPDALEVDFDRFYSLLHSRQGRIKAALLNQHYVSGIGNIYADEILFASGIHPRTHANRLSKARVVRLYEAMKSILQAAIQHRGSSISDYVDSSGVRGSFQTLHEVYGRTGMPCSRCGTAIRRSLVAQRGTHYCPRCQRP